MKIRVEFTKAQAGMVRFALREIQEYEMDAPDHKAATNALNALNKAQYEQPKP